MDIMRQMQSLNEQQYSICIDIMKENNWLAPYFGIFLVFWNILGLGSDEILDYIVI